jgi:hypothetical protein
MIESLAARVRNMRSRKWPICVGLLGAALFTVPAAFTPNLTLAMIYLSAAMYFVNMASGACWALATVAAPRHMVASLGSIQNFGGYFERFTPNTIIERSALDTELDATQARGYAEDREKNEEQIFCYGSAILGANREPVACVSISIPLYRKSATPMETYIAPLKDACRAITEGVAPGWR